MMQNYQDIWGGSNTWRTVSLQDKYLSSVLIVLAWMGMICFFVFGLFALLTKSDLAAILMIAALLTWVTSGIAVIRLKRTKRKVVTFGK